MVAWLGKKWIVAAGMAAQATMAVAQTAGQDTPQEIAQDSPTHPAPRDLCSDRPGLNTPACIVDPGRLQIELGIGDWTRTRTADQHQDLIELGQIALRYGITPTTEIRFGWTSYGLSRSRDPDSHAIDRESGVGDVTLGLKQNLRHPAEGKTGFALAVLPYVTLPTGHQDIGAGDWGAGLVFPGSYKLNDDVSLELTPEVDAAVNESGSGRHLAYGTAFGVQVHVTKAIRLTPEVQVIRDRDPGQAATLSKASLSIDAQPAKLIQVDLQCAAGLNRRTPDLEISAGVTRKF